MKRFVHKNNWKIWAVFVLTLIIGAAAFPNLPEQIPIHFDTEGVPDNYADKWSIFLAPAVILVLTLLAEFFKKYDPKSSSYEKFNQYYYRIHFAVALLMMGIQIYTIAYVAGWDVNLSRIMPVVIGALFIFLGNMMPKFKHNYFVGIRTSWTLADETVWYKTHRLTGKIWVVSGLLIALTAFLPATQIWWVLFIILAVMVIVPFIASFVYFNQAN